MKITPLHEAGTRSLLCQKIVNENSFLWSIALYYGSWKGNLKPMIGSLLFNIINCTSQILPCAGLILFLLSLLNLTFNTYLLVSQSCTWFSFIPKLRSLFNISLHAPTYWGVHCSKSLARLAASSLSLANTRKSLNNEIHTQKMSSNNQL